MTQRHRIGVSPETLDLLWRARLVIAARTGRPIHTITHDEIVRQALQQQNDEKTYLCVGR
jgi:DNA-binding transcriptional regulator YdaS (Cro superfamily)